jgi:hypothetical protein
MDFPSIGCSLAFGRGTSHQITLSPKSGSVARNASHINANLFRALRVNPGAGWHLNYQPKLEQIGAWRIRFTGHG